MSRYANAVALLLLVGALVFLSLCFAQRSDADTNDADGDGFTDDAERHIYQTTVREADDNSCGLWHQGWPLDIKGGGVPDSTNRVDILDLTSFMAPVRRLDTSPGDGTNLGDANYNVRWDLVPGPQVFTKHINITDLTAMQAGPTGNPPMNNGQKVYGSSFVCDFDHSEGRIRFFQKMEGRLENSTPGAFTQFERDFINLHYRAGSMYPACSDVGGPNPPCGYDEFFAQPPDRLSDGYIYLDWPRFDYNIDQGIPVTNSEILENANGDDCYYSGSTYGNPDWRMMDAGDAVFQDMIGDYFDGKLDNNPHYTGIYLDDMNLTISHVQCSSAGACPNSGSTDLRCPFDPRTGAVMTPANHMKYVREYAEYLRRRFSNVSILHNAQMQNVPNYMTEPEVAKLIAASDYQEIEHGCLDQDTPITGIIDRFNRIHANGAGVFHWGYDSNDQPIGDQARLYGLACHLLFTTQGDYYGSYEDGFPSNWWSGYDTDLGAAQGNYFPIAGGYRRNFDGGYAEVNTSTRTGNVVTFMAGALTQTSANHFEEPCYECVPNNGKINVDEEYTFAAEGSDGTITFPVVEPCSISVYIGYTCHTGYFFQYATIMRYKGSQTPTLDLQSPQVTESNSYLVKQGGEWVNCIDMTFDPPVQGINPTLTLSGATNVEIVGYLRYRFPQHDQFCLPYQ